MNNKNPQSSRPKQISYHFFSSNITSCKKCLKVTTDNTTNFLVTRNFYCGLCSVNIFTNCTCAVNFITKQDLFNPLEITTDTKMYGSYIEVMTAFNNQQILGRDEDKLAKTVSKNGNKQPNIDVQSALFSDETDFILVAEFCEEKGPVPMFTIPNEVKTNIDLNSYVMHVFSSDHQSLSSGPFKISKDVQVLMSDFENTHSYVHYFTLYDINARGYVRLMCLAYISRDQKKLMDNFSFLKKHFTQVATVLKHVNKSLFQNELENYCHNYLNDTNLANNLKKEDSFVKELQHVFHMIASLPVDFRLNDILSFVEEYALSLFHWERLYSLWPCRKSINPPANCGSSSLVGHKMKNLFELCMWGSILAVCLLLRVQKHYKKDAIFLMMEQEDDKLQLPDFGLLSMNDNILMNLFPQKNQPYYVDPIAASFTDELKIWFKDFFLKAFYSSDLKMTFAAAIECKPSKTEKILPELETDALSQAFQKCITCRTKKLSIQNFLTIPKVEVNPQQTHSILKTVGRFTPNQPGYGIANVYNTFPCFHHLLYSLFTGRLVIIVGTNSHQDVVRSVVQALDLFIPEKTRHEAVLPWSPKPLNLSDLVKYKLIGMNAKAFSDLSSGIQDYIAVLDVTTHRYKGPVYEGNILSHIRHLSSCKMTDDLLTFHIFNLLLTLINKMLIYYHYDTSEGAFESDGSFASSHELGHANYLKIPRHDAKIVKYFVDLLKNKQILALQMRNGQACTKFAPCLQLL